jgi:hypothetical protein
MGPDEKKMQRVKDLEDMKARGAGSFGQAMELAAKKMQLGVEEGMRDHPLAATLTGAAAGTVLGGTLGRNAHKLPDFVRSVGNLVESARK